MQDPFLFTVAVLGILGTPGPTNTLLATSAALVGVRRSLPLILAELAGYVLAIGALHAVLGSALAAYPGINAALRLLIGAYLLVVAFDLWRRRDLVDRPLSGVRFERVFVTTLLNPKAIVFAFGVIPLSQPDAAPYVLAFLGFVAVAGLAWIAAGALVGRMTSPPAARAIPRASALVLTVFAGLIVAG